MVSKILVVEDEEGIQEYLKDLLLDDGYSVETASDGISGLNIIKKSKPDLVILDLGLPNMTGDAVLTEIKKKYNDIPIIILTAKDATTDMVNTLNLGADDYITKPFVADVLLARVKARLRHGGEDNISIADLEVNSKTMEVKRNGRLIPLSPQEFKLLQYLATNKGRVLTREMILNRIWLYSYDVDTRVVDVYIGYLRKKIDSDFDKKLIHSVRGFGYIMKD